jgi:hypothetical protein
MQTLQSRWRNHRLLLGTAVLLVIAAGAAGVLWLGNFAETRRFAAIEIGMTEDEVLAILGPPGQYGPPGAKYCRSMCYL